MYLNRLQTNDLMTASRFKPEFAQVICSSVLILMIVTARAAFAESLVDTIEIDNKSAVTTGIVITEPNAEPDDSASEIDSSGGLQIKQYTQGERTIREYRSGGRLMYVETFKDGEPGYIFDHSKRDKDADRRIRAGFIISNW